MSRSVVIPALSMSIVVVAGVIDALKKMRLSKAEGIFPMAGQDGVNLPDGVQNSSALPVDADYPLAFPSLLMPLNYGSMPELAFCPSVIEGFMPLELPAAVRETVKEPAQKPVLEALAQGKVPELALLIQAQSEEPKATEDKKQIENLLGILEESGMRVKEMKELPSGATRITLDDLFKVRETREPVLVRRR